MKLELIKNNEHSYIIHNTINNKDLGKAIMDVDGSFYFWPNDDLCGSWTSHNLKQVSEILDQLSDDYEENIKKSHL